MKMNAKQTIRPTLNSERSPCVHYANWKETMLLQKQLSTLRRTESGLLHRITVDQKVMFRRFQVKLQRSKLAHARLLGQPEVEKELRGTNKRVLHCESHLFQGDDDFLSKLEQRPYGIDEPEVNNSANTRGDNSSMPKNPEQLPADEVTDEDLSNLVKSVVNEVPIVSTRHNLRSLTALGQILESSEVQLTPPDANISDMKAIRTKSALDQSNMNLKQTTYNASLDSVNQTTNEKDEKRFPKKKMDQSLPMISISGAKIAPSDDASQRDKAISDKGKENNDKNVNPNRRMRKMNICAMESTSAAKYSSPTKASLGLSIKQEEEDEEDQNSDGTESTSGSLSSINSLTPSSRKGKKDKHESTSSGKVTNKTKGLGALSPSNNNTNPIKIAGKESQDNGQVNITPRQKKTSIFEEYKRPDYRAQRLAKAKSINHSDLVRSFCDGLSDFGTGVPNFDYYASKMQAHAQGQVKTALIGEAPGTPEIIYRKYTGDQTIKCITMPPLKLRRGPADDVDDNAHLYMTYDSLILDSGDKNSDDDSFSNFSE